MPESILKFNKFSKVFDTMCTKIVTFSLFLIIELKFCFTFGSIVSTSHLPASS